MIVDSCRLMTEKFRESVIIEDPSLTKTFILLPSKVLAALWKRAEEHVRPGRYFE